MAANQKGNKPFEDDQQTSDSGDDMDFETPVGPFAKTPIGGENVETITPEGRAQSAGTPSAVGQQGDNPQKDPTLPGNSGHNGTKPKGSEEDDPATTFRGFPQPSVNERLESINIFLADEDPDRHLYFEERFEEINDYINHIDKHILPCNSTLLKNVKIMARAHKDWQENRDRRLPTGCVHAKVKQTTRTSTRLIDAETSKTILQTRKAFGVDTQVRTDHAPFTVTRVGDEVDFAKAMHKDANEDMLTADTQRNLLFVENQAYNMALSKPAMIPYWMHPTHGLPQTGQTSHLDSDGPLLEEPSETEKRRPYRKELRSYLQEREDMINTLLKKKDLSNAEFAKLEELLRLHEPVSVRKLYTEWQNYLHQNAEGSESPQVEKLRDAYHAARDVWLETFRYTGVYIVELPVSERSVEPGVFYLPGPFGINPEEDAELRERAGSLISLTERLRSAGSYRYLSQEDKLALDLIMINFAPENFRFQGDPFKISRLEDDDPLAIEWREWLDPIAHLKPKITPLKPGQMDLEDPSILCVAWKPSMTEETLDLSEIPPDKVWETESLVQKHLSPRFGSLSRIEMAKLRDLVSNFYHSYAVAITNKALKENTERQATLNSVTEDGGSNRQKQDKAPIARARIHVDLEELKATIEAYNEEAEEIMNDPEGVARGDVRELHEMDEEFTEVFAEWFKTSISGNTQANELMGRALPTVDFKAKAERRGIQRATIEMALNLLATNQEQHRPDDRFRILKLPPVYHLPRKEVPSALPLESWKRPVERDTFELTKKIAAYQQQKNVDYSLGREWLANSLPGQLKAPINFNGPCIALDGIDKHSAARGRLGFLADVNSKLAEAQKNSPRPLLQQMLRQIAWYSNPRSRQGSKLPDFSPLDARNLELLAELSQESWDEEAEPYNWTIFDDVQHDISLFLEFQKDILSDKIMPYIPLWQAPTEHGIPTEDDIALCAPVTYSPRTPSITGISLTSLKQKINDYRLGFGLSTVHMWTSQEVFNFLKFMSSHSRIHLHMDERGEFQASRVPFTGHPENKFVTSVEEASTSLGVYLGPDHKLAVRYDAIDTIGSPIVQPNKIEHFLSLAQRLGREILEWIEILATPADAWAQEDLIEDHLEDALKARELMQGVTVEDREEKGLVSDLAELTYDLKLLAMELDNHAPDLARDAGFVWDNDVDEPDLESATQQDIDLWQKRQSEYAAILQMKCLEELNNNFESRFPENEKVWEFAAHRVTSTTQTLNGKEIEVITRRKRFFSMQRWPLECQRPETQQAIINSGPKLPDKPVPAPAPSKPTREELLKEAMKPRKKEARHIRGRAPHFPFGETIYQQAYLSYRMEEDLKDVPEFQVKNKTKRWQFPWTEPKKPTVEPYSLPKIPDNWKPDNISRAEKHFVLTQWAREAPGFPDPDIYENYYTPEQIPYIKAHEAQLERELVKEVLEEELGKPVEKANQVELDAAREKLKIDPETGFFFTEQQIEAKVRKQEKGRKQQGQDGSNAAVRGLSKRGATGALNLRASKRNKT